MKLLNINECFTSFHKTFSVYLRPVLAFMLCTLHCKCRQFYPVLLCACPPRNSFRRWLTDYFRWYSEVVRIILWYPTINSARGEFYCNASQSKKHIKNSKEQSPSWAAQPLNKFILWNPAVHDRIHRIPTPVSIFNHVSPDQNPGPFLEDQF